ncbi:hypothetical protein F5X96DRAFT_670116 [Biscogniauxia mediterranea]|nr:hypothetical protein F5X96DRAFT_670116 [Biscogniauxia mediterranea]
MSRRPPQSGSGSMPQQNRQNEYFVPRDGIDREVITADICRYLGNDALVRPGNYENPQSGQIIQGYYINAYRNLTTAMIEDLKADSARWDQERRQQSASRSNTAGGTIASRDSNGVYSRSSNSPTVQYRNSDTHQSRQYYGPTEAGFQSADGSRDPYDGAPRYPGTGSGNYTGASGFPPQQQYGSQPGYAQQGFASQPPQFSAPPANPASYPSGHPMPGSGFVGQAGQDPPYQLVGADSRARTSADPPQVMYANDPYAGSRDSRDPRGDPRDLRDQRVPVTSVPASRTTYTTSGPSASPVYPTAGSGGSSYYPQNPSPANAPYPAASGLQQAQCPTPQDKNNMDPHRDNVTGTASTATPIRGMATAHTVLVGNSPSEAPFMES